MKHNWPEWIDRLGRDDVTEQELRDFQDALNASPEAKRDYMKTLYTEAKPSTNEHGKIARKDFCGWSALGPISLFIENVLGFNTIDAQKKEIHWRKHQPGLHGIRNLRFGDIIATILAKGKSCTVESTAPYTLIVNGKKFEIKKGTNTFGDNPPKL